MSATNPDRHILQHDEMDILIDENQNLLKELTELRKERKIWTETTHLLTQLEDIITHLTQESGSVHAENARLRRLTEELEKKLEKEILDSLEGRQKAEERLEGLMRVMRRDRARVKELEELFAVKELEGGQGLEGDFKSSERNHDAEDGYDDDHGESGSAGSNVSTGETSLKIQASLKDENARLHLKIQDLTTRISEKDAYIKTQDESILELQHTVSALMDEIEANFENSHFDHQPLSPPMSPMQRSASTELESALSTSESPALSSKVNPSLKPSSLTTLLPTTHSTQSNPSTPTTATQTTLNSLAAELSKLGESQSPSSDLGSGNMIHSLRSRLASLGLNTDGNRAVLKKRLAKYVAKKKAKAKKAEEMKSGVSET
ncbi:hypothetical protein HDV05_005036 [Chytridiales sp. JEL 0842]|nr:hypothetical protein HDV05_005036 [Chytridiales sp. JEL 0842]